MSILKVVFSLTDSLVEDEETFVLFGKPVKRLDLTGFVCPYALLDTKKALRTIKVGEILEVVTNNRNTAETSIPNMCRIKSWKFIVTKRGEKVWLVKILKL